MSMIKGPAIWVTMTALILGLTVAATAQDQQKDQKDQKDQKEQKDQKGRRNQQKQQQPQAQQAAVGPAAQSKDELDAFVALQNEQNPAKKIELTNGFIAKFPNS